LRYTHVAMHSSIRSFVVAYLISNVPPTLYAGVDVEVGSKITLFGAIIQCTPAADQSIPQSQFCHIHYYIISNDEIISYYPPSYPPIPRFCPSE
jgi:hypothetical protein